MLTIALTSIPPRFGTLHRVLQSLLNQTVPARILLSLPKAYRRFPGEVTLPKLPEQVIVFRPEMDFGPATKLLGALQAPAATSILYCDDDWLYASTWAETLLQAQPNSKTAVAASTFPVARLKRFGISPLDRVAQGFGGVLVHRDMFQDSVFNLPTPAFAADDIWLSGMLAARGIPVIEAKAARALCSPIETDGPSLQDARIGGQSRADANRACAEAVTTRFGIWPPVEVPRKQRAGNCRQDRKE